MSANKRVLVSVSFYTVLFIVSVILFFNTKFTGNDAAGNGMASGLTFLFGLLGLFIVALILTVINAFSFKNISQYWIKLLFFIPLILPLSVLAAEYFQTGIPKEPSIKEQEHRLTIQIKTTEKLENPKLSFMSSKGSYNSKLTYKKTEGSFYIYEKSTVIVFESDRNFYISSNKIKTQRYYLEIPYEPKIIPYTDWKNLLGTESNINEPLKLEFRYTITKSNNQ
ncbi:hypothetical protein [Flagellimonas eckloniae]|uniref:Uncharacterized protein n=1 Tax=Flagellimonas eckloniae TaxID=346185 RepID=A0A0Q0XHD6_9FLAO|nr:hypothetical protein [Allomuricauda eckloniae]KQC30470.1 hypothetical protein AAY42_11760 [Allomuricauda eckloniae]